MQFFHCFVTAFPLHHPHFCNTSFSTYWNQSPPQPASRSLSQLTILFRATQYLQSALCLTAGQTDSLSKFGCPHKTPDLSVQRRDKHPRLYLSGISCHPHAGCYSPPKKAVKSRTLIREMLRAGMRPPRWMSPGSTGRGAGVVRTSTWGSSVWSLGAPRTQRESAQARRSRHGGWRWIATGYKMSHSHLTCFCCVFTHVFFSDATRTRSAISCSVNFYRTYWKGWVFCYFYVTST